MRHFIAVLAVITYIFAPAANALAWGGGGCGTYYSTWSSGCCAPAPCYYPVQVCGPPSCTTSCWTPTCGEVVESSCGCTSETVVGEAYHSAPVVQESIAPEAPEYNSVEASKPMLEDTPAIDAPAGEQSIIQQADAPSEPAATDDSIDDLFGNSTPAEQDPPPATFAPEEDAAGLFDPEPETAAEADTADEPATDVFTPSDDAADLFGSSDDGAADAAVTPDEAAPTDDGGLFGPADDGDAANELFNAPADSDDADGFFGTPDDDAAPAEEDSIFGTSDDATTPTDDMPAGDDGLFGGASDDVEAAFPSADDAPADEDGIFGAPDDDSASDDDDGLFGTSDNADEMFGPAADAPADEDALFGSPDDADAMFGPADDADAPADSGDDMFDTDSAPAEGDAPGEESDEFDIFGGAKNLSSPGGLASRELRTWVDNTGKYQCNARLLKIAGDSVVILKDNGKEKTVSFARLSQDDLSFAKQQSELQNALSLQTVNR